MPQPHHRLPSMSQRMPSGVPPGPASMSTRLLAIFCRRRSRRRPGSCGWARRGSRRRRGVSRPARSTARWAQHALGDDRRLAGAGIEAVDVGADLGLRLVALVVGEDAEGGIGEPDRAVRLHDHVVGRVEPLAVELVDQRRDRAVVLGARDAPPAVLAGDEPALAVARVAVGEVRGLAVDADRARLLLPLQDAVVGDVAPQQIAARRRNRPGPSAQRQPVARRSTQESFSQYFSKRGSSATMAGSG